MIGFSIGLCLLVMVIFSCLCFITNDGFYRWHVWARWLIVFKWQACCWCSLLFLLHEKLLCLFFGYVFLYFFFDGVFVSLVSVLVVWFSNHGFFMLTFVTVALSCCGMHACERTQSICWYLRVFLMVHKRPCNNNWHLQSHLIIKCAF